MRKGQLPFTLFLIYKDISCHFNAPPSHTEVTQTNQKKDQRALMVPVCSLSCVQTLLIQLHKILQGQDVLLLWLHGNVLSIQQHYFLCCCFMLLGICVLQERDGMRAILESYDSELAPTEYSPQLSKRLREAEDILQKTQNHNAEMEVRVQARAHSHTQICIYSILLWHPYNQVYCFPQNNI